MGWPPVCPASPLDRRPRALSAGRGQGAGHGCTGADSKAGARAGMDEARAERARGQGGAGTASVHGMGAVGRRRAYFSPGRGSRPRGRATSRARRPRSILRAGPRAAVARDRPRARPAAAASTSCPSRSAGSAAGTSTGSRCAACTGSCTAPSGPATACDLDTESPAHAAAAAAQDGPTAHPTRSTAMSPHQAEGSTPAPDTTIRADPPLCVSRSKSHDWPRHQRDAVSGYRGRTTSPLRNLGHIPDYRGGIPRPILELRRKAGSGHPTLHRRGRRLADMSASSVSKPPPATN